MERFLPAEFYHFITQPMLNYKEIIMTKYKLTKTGVQDTEIGAFIPDSLGNREWRKYQKWLMKPNNKPDPEFSEEELAAQQQAQIRQIESAIVDMQLKLNTAKIEKFIALADELQTEIIRLRAELEALQEA